MDSVPNTLIPPEYFRRVDETDDSLFYSIPRLVAHIDEAACESLARLYAELLPRGGNILDLMSSYISHLPEENTYRSVVGVGMNQPELEANPQLTHHIIHNLNQDPILPLKDSSFDACLIAVSIQYLVRPIEVIADISRILKKDSPCVVSFSNRMFPTKAVRVWRSLDDEQHAQLIEMYFNLSGQFDDPQRIDLSPKPGESDPLYAVVARSVT